MATGVALPGKFARFRVGGNSVIGAFRWNVGFRRERLDTTTFESATDTINVASDGVTGVLDTTFQVENYANVAEVNIFFPQNSLLCDLFFNKTTPLGYHNITADVLSWSPATEVRQTGKGTAELQANGYLAVAS